MKILLSLILLAFSVSGCAQPTLYAWEKYPFTLYQYKKDPTEEKLKNHKDMLLSIFEVSRESNLRVPPGLYCEYGFILLKEGKTQDAIEYFDLEEKTYPESSVLIGNLKSYVIMKTGSNNLLRNMQETKVSDNLEGK